MRETQKGFEGLFVKGNRKRGAKNQVFKVKAGKNAATDGENGLNGVLLRLHPSKSLTDLFICTLVYSMSYLEVLNDLCEFVSEREVRRLLRLCLEPLYERHGQLRPGCVVVGVRHGVAAGGRGGRGRGGEGGLQPAGQRVAGLQREVVAVD